MCSQRGAVTGSGTEMSHALPHLVLPLPGVLFNTELAV